MRKLFTLFVLIILAFSAFVPMAAAQESVESSGCTATDGLFQSGVGPYTFGPYDYFIGEHVIFSFAGPADSSFSLSVNGTGNTTGIEPGSEVDYAIVNDGTYTFTITVSNGTTGNSASTDCLNADEAPDFAPGTLCHIPPGNPNAAHTIRVGLPAVEAHLAHGDTEGPCPDGVDTRYDNPGAGITIFIIFATGEIQIYGNCDDEGECEEVTNTPLIVVINFEALIAEGGYIEVPEGEEPAYELPDSAPEDGMSVVIYYLHPDPDDSSVGVFQINIYKDGVLVDDSVLLFITADGTIILWTSHNIWEEELAAALEEDED